MILIFLILTSVFMSMYSKSFRHLLIIALSMFLICGQIAIVVSDNMRPNINIGDYVLCIKPTINIPNSNIVIADFSKIPLLGNLLKYRSGQTVIVKSNKSENDITIIKPKILRIICCENDVLRIRNNNMYINGYKIKYDRFSNYIIEKLPNGSSYLITSQPKINSDVIQVEKNKVLCMYDNRESDDCVISILDRRSIQSIPLLNLTNIIKYYKFLVI